MHHHYFTSSFPHRSLVNRNLLAKVATATRSIAIIDVATDNHIAKIQVPSQHSRFSEFLYKYSLLICHLFE